MSAVWSLLFYYCLEGFFFWALEGILVQFGLISSLEMPRLRPSICALGIYWMFFFFYFLWVLSVSFYTLFAFVRLQAYILYQTGLWCVQWSSAQLSWYRIAVKWFFFQKLLVVIKRCNFEEVKRFFSGFVSNFRIIKPNLGYIKMWYLNRWWYLGQAFSIIFPHLSNTGKLFIILI